MGRSKLEVADIFRAHGGAYRREQTGHLTMTKAFAAAPMTVTQPATFLQLVWAVLLGATVFGEQIDGWVILGGAVIMASVSFITWREAVARRKITPVVHTTKA